MFTDANWGEQTRRFLRDKQAELEEARKRVDHLAQVVAGLQMALDEWQSEHQPTLVRVASPPTSGPSSKLTMDPSRSVPDLLMEYARQHGGRLVMTEAGRFFTQIGKFRDNRKAAGILYPTIRRLRQFERIEPGIYRLVDNNAASSAGLFADSTDG